jgi:hypothetical protein
MALARPALLEPRQATPAPDKPISPPSQPGISRSTISPPRVRSGGTTNSATRHQPIASRLAPLPLPHSSTEPSHSGAVRLPRSLLQATDKHDSRPSRPDTNNIQLSDLTRHGNLSKRPVVSIDASCVYRHCRVHLWRARAGCADAFERSAHPVCSLCPSRSSAPSRQMPGLLWFSKMLESHFSPLCGIARMPFISMQCQVDRMPGVHGRSAQRQ